MSETDYETDFSVEAEDIITHLLANQGASFVIEENPILGEVEFHDTLWTLRVPRVLGRERTSPEPENPLPKIPVSDLAEAVLDISRPHLPANVEVLGPEENDGTIEQPSGILSIDDHDPRSPLERFRAQSHKALSVTDLVSTSWCELQYFYTLKHHGRKTQTPAMKQGSRIHQTLQDEIFETVKVDVQTREDRWGLRIWNTIQGLNALRNRGQTRELEVWGILHGQVVNGVIDDLSFVCPDTDLEARLEKEKTDAGPHTLEDQPTIVDFFSSSKASCRVKRRAKSGKLYICDVKTRASSRLPSAAAFRPTQYQLMLYHHLLSSLASNNVDLDCIASRFGLDTALPFSDGFIAQVGSINESAPSSQSATEENEDSWALSQDSVGLLLAHNSIASLWGLMIRSFQAVLPQQAESLGGVLKAEYRSRATGEVLGMKTFAMDQKKLDLYLAKEIDWWEGKRPAEGVEIEEAFKCQTCEFAENCEWRLTKVDEAQKKSRSRREGVEELSAGQVRGDTVGKLNTARESV